MPKAHIPVLKVNKPKKRSNRKIITVLLLLFIAILVILFFRSPISQVTEIQFTGSTFSTREQLLQASGLKMGSQYFGVSPSKAESQLLQIKSIQKTVVDKHFPGKINVSIEEYPTVAYELGAEGNLDAILANGSKVSVNSSGIAVEKPILTKWSADDPNKAKLCKVLGQIPNELTSDISEIMPSPTASFPDRIKMYTRSRFVVITATSLLSNKIEYLNQVIETATPGTITMLEADSYIPFQLPGTEETGQNATTHGK
ncbi:FtsQ-type POTRA domain-containing protein [Paenibacillus sp.]|jgi:cell division protein FtsQ|uniref:cell division protein FtsQ/DivIB n=1 Tax=Paenibacillus sp. TaxID=58172 RepID=UPI002820B9FE|nr:FtsQ-type POTRA domain-containing protein [Paenibacillus sp.]MDR0268926.1 FtsQ-type POTRA domain-containing protein [Paenibacillus sp.]